MVPESLVTVTSAEGTFALEHETDPSAKARRSVVCEAVMGPLQGTSTQNDAWPWGDVGAGGMTVL